MTIKLQLQVDDRLPIVEISHIHNSTVMNQGSSEWFYVDLYTVPETSYKYTLSIYAAYYANSYGETDLFMSLSSVLSISFGLMFSSGLLDFSFTFI